MRQIIFDGNSLVDGANSSTGGHGGPNDFTGNDFPAQCARMFTTGGPYTFKNFGVSGQSTTMMINDAVTQIDSLYNPAYEENILVAWEITNAMCLEGGTVDSCYQQWKTYCLARKAAGWKVITLTVIKRHGAFSGGAYNDTTFEPARNTINGLIRAEYRDYCDAVADVADLSGTDPVYPGGGDSVHLYDPGYAIVANTTYNTIQSILGAGNTTPAAPTLAADDSADTLAASHALGTSEILVSVNNGAYAAYSGTISVGNFTRAAGYWKFKVKAATGRNESAVVSSPAFNAAAAGPIIIRGRRVLLVGVTTTPLATPVITLGTATATTQPLSVADIANATGYEWQQSPDNATWSTITGSGNSVTATGLTASTLYHYRVRAITTTSGYSASAYGTASGSTAAAPSDGMTNVVFGNTANGVTETAPGSHIWTGSGPNTYDVSTVQMGANGIFQYDYDGATSDGVVIGLSPNNTPANYNNTDFSYGMYIFNGQMSFLYNGSPSGTSGTFAAGDKARLYRFSNYDNQGVLRNYINIDKQVGGTGNWGTFSQLNVSDGEVLMYLKVAFAVSGKHLVNPKATGLSFNSGSTFTLAGAARTSAGVYNTAGTLVRTLWSGEQKTAGSYAHGWDNKDDAGNAVPSGTYTAKMLSNNVQYQWQGARIGNTSTDQTGSGKWHGFSFMNTMCISGGTGYYGLGYSENDTSQGKFPLNAPGSKTAILYQYHATSAAVFYSCTDGVNVYWTGGDNGNWFTFATKVADDTEASFSSGAPYQTVWGRQYGSVIDMTQNTYILGSAVQKTGNYLFIAHVSIGQIHVLHKTTGALVQTLSGWDQPRFVCTDSDDNLWVVSGSTTVTKHTVNSDGTLSSATRTLSGLVNPSAIACNAAGTVLVADGGTSQQVKGYESGATSPSWTFGQLGGYMVDAAVANDKFYFSDLGTNNPLPFICFQSDGSFWVGDGGNYRVQHYAADRTFIDRIMFLPHSYSMRVDKNNPTRVFNEYLEFAIDYALPLDNGTNGSWTLVKNWRGAVPTQNYYLTSVMTLSNNRTYGLLTNQDNHVPAIVELPATGVFRSTGISLDAFSNAQFDQAGNLRSAYLINSETRWYKQALTGFDGSGNPQYSAGVEMAHTPEIAATDPTFGGQFAPYPASITSTGLLLSFNGAVKEGYHLGGIAEGAAAYKWKTASSMPGGTANTAEFPTDGRFDTGNGIARPGTVAMAVERSIIWGYGGEFWRGYQINMFNHVHDTGLFLGQFGTKGVDHYGQDCSAEMAGNVFSPELVKVGSDYYLYHNDEFFHSGVHRWKVTGLDTIQEQAVTVTV